MKINLKRFGFASCFPPEADPPWVGMLHASSCERGAILPLIIVFGAILMMIFGGLTNFLLVEQRSGFSAMYREQAFEAAEAGLNYYRWRFSHAPTDYQTTQTIDQDVTDPQGGLIGHFTIQVTPPDACGGSLTVNAAGWDIHAPAIKRTLRVQLGQPSLAQYAFLVNSVIWFGSAANVLGPIHANGGLRMDGTQNAVAESAQATYQCAVSTGCSPPQPKPGVWGSGPGGSQGLWVFPMPAVDFNALTVNLSQFKTTAQAAGSYYGPSGAFGYEVTLKQNDTYDIRKVTKLYPAVWAWTGSQQVQTADQIKQTQLLGTFPLSSLNCDASHIIFVEDKKVWVDGNTRSKVTIAAGQFPANPQTNSTIIINGDIKNPNPKQSQIALIAQKDIRIPLNSNNNLEIDAVLVAQNGTFIRWFYDPYSYPADAVKNQLTVVGTIMSSVPSGVAWGNPVVVSGYQNRNYSFNANLISNPPPFLPTTGQIKQINWQER